MENKFTDKLKGRSIILFEDLTYFSLPVIYFYLIIGFKILFINISQRFESSTIYERLITDGKIIKISESDLSFVDLYTLQNEILSEIDSLYADEFDNDASISMIKKLVNSPLIEGSYKKSISSNLFISRRIIYFLESIHQSIDNNDRIVFVASHATQIFYNFRSSQTKIPHTWIHIPLWCRIINRIYVFGSKVKVLLIFLFYPFWILFQIRIPSDHKKDVKTFQIGIRISNDDWSLSNKYRSFDFLVDHDCITATNVFFCIEEPISAEYQKALSDKQYHAVELRKVLQNADVRFVYNKFIKKQVPVWLNLLFRSFSKSPFIIILTLEILYKELLWQKLLEDYHMKHFVSYNEYLPSDIIRFICCDQKQIQTWNYAHSCGTNDFFTPPRHDDILDTLFSFYAYHHMILWGGKMERFYHQHPNFIQNFDRMGCFWSELVVRSREKPSSNEVLVRIKNKFLNNKEIKYTVGVFDTSFGETCPCHYGNIIDFIQGILQLLNDFPEIGVIYKNKKSLKTLSALEPAIVPYYKKIQEHPRCYFTDTENADPAETIAISDLVISAPFTSPNIEALGSRTKAVYYDASGQFREYYYDQFPQFVAHNYKELSDLVEYWLKTATDNDFKKFLNTYIKGEIDEHLDGMAITRFRKKLCE
ncbi:MAG: polysaccharide biosynthesis PFTS motif protein [Methanoregula sp.]